jgi:hypothetical protein
LLPIVLGFVLRKVALGLVRQGHPTAGRIEQSGFLQRSARGDRELEALGCPIPAFLRV